MFTTYDDLYNAYREDPARQMDNPPKEIPNTAKHCGFESKIWEDEQFFDLSYLGHYIESEVNLAMESVHRLLKSILKGGGRV